MNDLKSFAAKLRSFSFENETVKIVEDNKAKLADLQAEQWAQSKDLNGEPIELIDNQEFGYGYRPYTIEQKKRNGRGLGAVTSRITLFQTGSLYRSLFAAITQKKFFISSNVEYFKPLMKRLNQVEGLDEERRQTFGTEVYLPAIKQVLKAKTGIEF